MKILQAATIATSNAEYILSTESNLTTSNEEGEQQDYFFTTSKIFSTSTNKLEKASIQEKNH
jgi:hypothetical protein